jgi:type VI secretion system protein ImpG
MDELLPHYERELLHLRHYAKDFAQRYPKIAGRLEPVAEHGDDPHIEQTIGASALLSARIGKKLEDDYPQLIEALFEVLHPHYLRPFPACSIAQFIPASANAGGRAYTLARGTELRSRSIDGVQCRFKTAYDVTIAPLAIGKACYLPISAAPVVLPLHAAGIVSITFESRAPVTDLRALDQRHVRVHLNGEPSFISALADGMLIHALASYVETDGSGRWRPLRAVPIAQAGFDEEEALLDYPMRSHPAYRTVAEYFGFQEKFNFVDVDLGAMLEMAESCRSVTLHVVLEEGHGSPHAARLLETLSLSHLALFATPVVNVFPQHGEPVRVSHTAVGYPVLADASHAAAYDIYSIDSVRLVRQTPNRDQLIELRPFYSLRHGDEERSGHYWFARRDEKVALASPGYETEISVVDVDIDLSAAQTDTLSLELTCTNRDLPSRLAIGLEGGDLFMHDGVADGAAFRIAMLRRPTRTLRFTHDHDLHLRLASHLALDEVPLTNMDVAALKAALILYDVQQSAVSARHIQGIVDVELRDAEIELPGNPFGTSVRGIELRLTIDERYFVGASIATFVNAINTFLGNCVQLNSFVQLTIVSKERGEEIVRCKPRSSDLVLA